MTEEVTPLDLEDESIVVKEMYDLEVPKVDVVKGPASRRKFIMIKAQGPQDPEAIAAVQKAAASTASMNDRPDSDFAYIEPGGTKDDAGKTTPRSLRHFPIYDEAHARNALSRAPQSPFGDKAMPKIRAAAKKFGIDVTKQQEVVMTESSSQPTSETEPVKKADTTLDAGEVLAEADKGDPTDAAEDPGSPAWEAVDAATARKWTAILARAKGALGVMADREQLEVAVGAGDGDPSDLDSAWNLEDAACAIDYAISVLAPFAVDEQTEVDTQVDAVAKAMVQVKTDDLDVIESLGPVKKAGRVLSASNEAAIRGAVESLQKVLASLPAAPEDVTKSKEAPVEPSKPVTKAKGDPMVPVYDANGKLCGMVDAEDVVPIAAAPGADTEPAPAPPEDGKEVAGADGAAAATPDATQAPAAAEPSGAANAAPAEAPPDQQAVAKAQSSQLADQIKSAVDEAIKAADEEHQKVVKSLGDRIKSLEDQPMPGGPLLGGLNLGGMKALDGTKVALRGQTDPVEDAELVRITKALETVKDPVEHAQLMQELSTRRMALRLGAPVKTAP